MSKLKNLIIFVLALLIIFLLNIYIYVNIDKLIPKHENELYTFTNSVKEDNTNFLYEMYSQIRRADNYKKISDKEKIKENKVVYNLIKNYIYENKIDEDEFDNILAILYIGNLTNTIYGDLEFITTGYDYYIAYSKDMKKFFYFNNSQEIFNNTTEGVSLYSVDPNNKYEIELGGIEKEEKQIEQDKEEIIKMGKKSFSKAMLDVEFNPDTIIYVSGSYVLKDKQKDITIYYSKDNDIVFGFYMGFEV